MAQLNEKYNQFLEKYSEKKQFNTVIAVLVFVFIVGAFFTYRYFGMIQSMNKQMTSLNKARRETQRLLAQDKEIKKQQAKVEDMLVQQKNFKLKEFFQSIIDRLKLQPYVVSDRITRNELRNMRAADYQEILLEAQLHNMNIKQVADLLYEVEQNERVYTKSVEIKRSATNPVVDLTITIGTLQKKASGGGA